MLVSIRDCVDYVDYVKDHLNFKNLVENHLAACPRLVPEFKIFLFLLRCFSVTLYLHPIPFSFPIIVFSTTLYFFPLPFLIHSLFIIHCLFQFPHSFFFTALLFFFYFKISEKKFFFCQSVFLSTASSSRV